MSRPLASLLDDGSFAVSAPRRCLDLACAKCAAYAARKVRP